MVCPNEDRHATSAIALERIAGAGRAGSADMRLGRCADRNDDNLCALGVLPVARTRARMLNASRSCFAALVNAITAALSPTACKRADTNMKPGG
jgi:hypothetical protein